MIDAVADSVDLNLIDTGIEVLDLDGNVEFSRRPVRAPNPARQMEAMRRLARAFVDDPESMLQELVDAAVDLCGADSAGISMEQDDKQEDNFYHWVATAGQYKNFQDATLPRYPSACGICLERGQPQLFRVSQPFFDQMQVDAPTVTDGILLPWQVEQARGTIWIMAHGRTSAFNEGDLRIMQTFADFVAMAIRQRRQQRLLVDQATTAAAAAMANELAHRINNPLQALTNMMFLAAEGHGGMDARTLARQAAGDIERLAALVRKILDLPVPELDPD